MSDTFSASGGSVDPVTAAWTSATAVDTTLAIVCANHGTVMFSHNPVGTITGGRYNFEGSDDFGVTWYNVIVTWQFGGLLRSNEIFDLSGQIGYVFFVHVAGLTNFRVRLNPVIAGAGTANVRLQAFEAPAVLSMVMTQANANSLRVQLSDGTDNNLVTTAGAVSVDDYTTAANLAVTATAATGVGVTATLPAVASQFHYITLIEVLKYFTATNAASGTPLVITTTNLPGSPAFTMGRPLGTIGTTDTKIYAPSSPLKSSVVNTATTIVCPATTGIIWSVNVWYRASV